MLATGIRTPVRNTSLKCADPLACTSGRTSTPGLDMSRSRKLMPRCLGTLGSMRTSRNPQLQNCADEFQTFCPSTTNSSPSTTARVASPARSEPAPGSLNNWHHVSSARSIGGR